MSTDTASPKPLIAIDDLVREATDEEYAIMIENGWTPNGETPR